MLCLWDPVSERSAWRARGIRSLALSLVRALHLVCRCEVCALGEIGVGRGRRRSCIVLVICVHPPVSEIRQSADLKMQQASRQSPSCLFGDYRFIFLKGFLSGSSTDVDANTDIGLES